MKSEHREMLALSIVVLVAAILWYFFWVKPHNEALSAIMDCMGPDGSRAAYDVCVTLLKR